MKIQQIQPILKEQPEDQKRLLTSWEREDLTEEGKVAKPQSGGTQAFPQQQLTDRRKRNGVGRQ